MKKKGGKEMKVFDPGFDIAPCYDPLGFSYGKDVFGPVVENRYLNDIRASLIDPTCQGPDIVYAIAMDVGRDQDREAMIKRNLLYGAVTYAKGTLGKEPVRSQGHIHALSPSCGYSTCEVYEIWSGEAYIYMQESAKDDPGRCFAIHACQGDIVIVPPGWAHATIVGNIHENLTFGAWCVRDYGFDYEDVRAHHGVAWFPIVENGDITFMKNDAYQESQLIVKEARAYPEFNIVSGKSIYQQFIEDPDRFLFVSKPQMFASLWKNFEP